MRLSEDIDTFAATAKQMIAERDETITTFRGVTEGQFSVINKLTDEISKLTADKAELLALVRWMKQTVHHAHHLTQASENCSASICQAASAIITKHSKGDVDD